ncbi:LOW QUALITY PROTEIN: RNA polymerase II degradation factor 1 [Drosophila subobscura]|uniref:LOW QUALITY PROTEIN: RNA polymerase II degradation factor 1 n=1 Tax=Drosophila subobscura TaxID=7241 RepID=UPI00155A77B1|nr:LOW QUALITY PROTEIN: RNA polymerase II degradation factor 1 [Drosophila subobscura]
MHSLRLLVLLGLLMAAAQAGIIESGVATEQVKVPPALQIGASPEAIKPVEAVEVEKLKEILGIQENQVIPEEKQVIQANQETPEVKSEVNQREQQQKEQVTGPILPKEVQQKPQPEQPKEQAEQPKGQIKGREIELVFEQPGQTLLQYDNVGQLQGLPNLDKIFKYPGAQQLNGSDAQYSHLFNKFHTGPRVEFVPTWNTTGANVTQHIHNHTHYYQNQNQKKPFPFLPNPFEKQETTYVNRTSPSGNVTYVYEEGKPSGGGAFPFPPLPNPFTDFPKVVGLSLVLLPNPFYKGQSGSGNPQPVNPTEPTKSYQYFEKFRGFADESSSNQQQNQQQKTGNRFYLISNPLLNQASEEGRGEKVQNTNVLLPVNLAALPLLVPAPESSQETAPKQEPTVGTIKIEDLLKTSKFYVGQPLQFPAGNGIGIGNGQKQSQNAAIQQLILAQLNQQQNSSSNKLPLKDERRSQSAVVPVEEGEESSVLFAVEIPKPIYRFFKGIFGGFSG